ncbi:MAG: hypothetical protein KGL51_07000 [Betaproteobacteria bacterium]|nr:hypothetical protein [Betaproteobacteria bacterium]
MNIRSCVLKSVIPAKSAQPQKITPVDQMVAEEGLFALSPAQVESVRREFVRQAAQWHLQSGSSYAAYASRQGFRMDMLATADGVGALPLLPSMLFKREALRLAHPAATDILWTTSSGTKGSISRIPRDDITLRRFFASIGNLSNEMLDIQNSDITVFNLGPDADEANNLWISYVMAGITVMLPKSRYYVQANRLLLEDLIHDLQATLGQRIALMGPPPLLADLAHALVARRIRLQPRPDSLVVTIGGWKRRSGERMPRAAFDELLAGVFQLPSSQVRDTFNMVELNSVLVECEHKLLHVPPWLYVRARDPGSLGVLPGGHSGVLSYLDPTARSFPCFVLSDDLGSVDENYKCACGRCSDVLRIERRLNTVESRGCALKMDSFVRN